MLTKVAYWDGMLELWRHASTAQESFLGLDYAD